MEHIGSGHLFSSETHSVGVASDLEHSTAYIRAVTSQEIFDVIPVDSLASIESENGTDRFQPSQASKPHPAECRRKTQIPLLSSHPLANLEWNDSLCRKPHKV